MNKKLLGSTIAVAFAAVGATSTASAALATNATLDFDDGATGGNYGFVVSGSYFAMDTNGSGTFTAPERVAIANAGSGLEVGTAQAAGTIDNSWVFFGPSGSHATLSATNIISQTANSADLDFSGWTVDWNGVEINMGSGGSNGVATVTCANDCSLNDTFTLDYLATVPDDGATDFGNVAYALHLEGTIGEVSAIPVPAAVWLFGSGLVGLAGVARRRKAS